MTAPFAWRAVSERAALELVVLDGPAVGRRFGFSDHVEIGRWDPGLTAAAGVLLVDDATVSSRHCMLTRGRDGRCFVRDVSRNGTRLDDHRLVPGVECEILPGQVLSLGRGVRLRLEAGAAPAQATAEVLHTTALPTGVVVTVVVGDLRGYTTLVQLASPAELQRSLNALFRELEAEVARLGGTVKEYAGDALLAFWEEAPGSTCAARACRAVLALDQAARRLAADPAVWSLPGHPARMDWALATGPVTLERMGGDHPIGLSAVGEPMVLAYRLEKLADDATGAILACPDTRALAGTGFRFRALGARSLPGFEAPQAVFALEGAL